MPLDSLEFRTSLQKLLIGLILILVPLTIFGFYMTQQGENHIRQSSGENFRSLTLTAAEATSDFIADSVRELSLIANAPGPIQAVNQSNKQYNGMSAEETLSKLNEVDLTWESPQADRLSMQILTSDLAHQLRRERELSPALLKITVSDLAGAAVAATDRPGHYAQMDRPFWDAVAASGRGAIRISDLRYDDQSRRYYLSVAYPILQEGTGRFIGAVSATVDMTSLFARLHRQQIGRTGRMFLVRDDGTVIEAPGITPSMQIKSEEYAAVRDALGSVRGRGAGYLYTNLANGEQYLIGFADTGLKDAYPNLPWIVLASQEAREVTGPIRGMTIFALLIMIVALLVLSLLGAYVFEHRRQKFEDIETPDDGDKLHPIAV